MGRGGEADKAKVLMAVIAVAMVLFYFYPLGLEATGCDGLPVRTDALRDELLRLNNNELAKLDARALCLHPQLQEVAQDQAEDMLERGYYSFETPEGLDARERVAKAGYPSSDVSEIHNRLWAATKGEPNIGEVRLAFDKWMEDEGRYRYASTASRWSEVGFGVATGQYEPESGTTTTIYVATFGNRE